MGRVASWQFVVFTCLLAFLTSLSQGVSIAVAALSYDVVYVRQLRFGDNTSTTWPEVFHPALIDAVQDPIDKMTFEFGIGPGVTPP